LQLKFGWQCNWGLRKMHGRLSVRPDRLDEEPTILGRIRRGERIDHYETIRQRKDGSLVNISLTVSPVKNAQGKIVGASKNCEGYHGSKARR
jgi:PAS domain S-box-containing protein